MTVLFIAINIGLFWVGWVLAMERMKILLERQAVIIEYLKRLAKGCPQ